MERNSKIALFSAVVWTISVTVLSLIPLGDVGKNIAIDNTDKYVHFTFYFIFVIVWFTFLKKYFHSINMKYYAVFMAIGFGILMEICQGLFTKTRCADINDVFANSIGALFGLLFISFLKTKKTTA